MHKIEKTEVFDLAFVVQKAKREGVKVKLAFMGSSGSGKTYSALKVAKGMAEEIEKTTGKKAKVVMANTEASRGRYYADEFEYDIIDLAAPHNPEMYVEMINYVVSEGYDILIIDSSSMEWTGKGGCLELHQQMGGQYQAWAKITPRHNKFIEAMADSPLHIIATMRGKDQYEVERDDRGKTNIKKLGVGANQREGFEYEFTCTFLIDQQSHIATVQKDNTHIFDTDPQVLLNENYGAKIMQWAESGEGYTPPVRNRVEDVTNPDETEDDLVSIKKKITLKCTELGGTKNEEMMTLLKQYTSNGNPNAIRSVDKAKEVFEKLQTVKKVD